LQNYLRFAEQIGDTVVRSKMVIEWAGMAPSLLQKRNRLLTVRRFYIATQAENNQHEITFTDVFGRVSAKRKIRHLFSAADISLLLTAASQLTKGAIRSKTYTTLFALLSATGLRSREAIRLNIAYITEDGLLINSTKFRKDRLVPIHAVNAGVKARLFAAVFKNTYFVFDLLFIFNIIIDGCGVRGKGGEAAGKLVDNFEHAKK
jgi:integrase